MNYPIGKLLTISHIGNIKTIGYVKSGAADLYQPFLDIEVTDKYFIGETNNIGRIELPENGCGLLVVTEDKPFKSEIVENVGTLSLNGCHYSLNILSEDIEITVDDSVYEIYSDKVICKPYGTIIDLINLV